MSRSTRILLAAALSLAPLLAACAGDDASVIDPETPQPGGPLFDRYVALGNSITAGVQSGGITAATQAETYPVLVAAQAGAEFAYPVLAGRGCTPLFRGPFVLDTVRIGAGSTSRTCDLLVGPGPPVIHNLAVPGATVGDAIDNLRPGSASNVLTTLLLGGRTQTEALIEMQPTLVSVWLGTADVLSTATLGDTTLLTRADDFRARLDSVVTAINLTPAGSGTAQRDAVLIGVAPFIALTQPGAFLRAFQDQNPAAFRALTGKTVNASCAFNDQLAGPAPGPAFNLVSLAVFADPSVTAIDCGGNGGIDYVLTLAEQQAVFNRIAAYNAAIRTAAEENGWIYLDPNGILGGPGATPATLRARLSPAEFRLCQGIFTATAATLAAAIAATCPGPTPPGAPYVPGSAAYQAFFGTHLSFDGVHPSAIFHRRIANAIITVLNAKHGLGVPGL